MTVAEHHGTIFLEDCSIVSHEHFPGNQHIVRVAAPLAAETAQAGMFAHIRCADAVPMRRPLSIMRADRRAGWLEFLYKPVGPGLNSLTDKKPGERISILAPIGKGFVPDPTRPRIVAIGGGVGIPPMIFLATELAANSSFEPIVLMGSETPFPFAQTRSALPVHGSPGSASNGLALLENMGVPSRLASSHPMQGCYQGMVTELAGQILRKSNPAELHRTHILACGPSGMLAAVAELAREYEVRCDIALEEYMACGVGGCAGCTVEVTTESGTAMKRVCVDGPVFSAQAIYPR